jgi:hypothetical protein
MPNAPINRATMPISSGGRQIRTFKMTFGFGLLERLHRSGSEGP